MYGTYIISRIKLIQSAVHHKHINHHHIQKERKKGKKEPNISSVIRAMLGSGYLLDFTRKERCPSGPSLPISYHLNISDGPNDTWERLDLNMSPQTMSFARCDIFLLPIYNTPSIFFSSISPIQGFHLYTSSPDHRFTLQGGWRESCMPHNCGGAAWNAA